MAVRMMKQLPDRLREPRAEELQAEVLQAEELQAEELQVTLAQGAHALDTEGNLQASWQNFERAYQLAEQAGDVQAMAIAALGLGGLWVRERRTVAGAAQLAARLQHVLPMLDPHSSLALRIRARLAGEADYSRGEHTVILAVLEEARSAAAPVALAEVLSIAHHCLLAPDHVLLRRELAVELTKVSFITERRSDFLMGLLWQTVDSYTEGDPHAGRLLGELREHLRQGSHLAAGFVVSAIEVMLAIRAGRFGEAESLARTCAESGAAAGDIDSEWWCAAQLATIRWYQGRLGELLPALQERAQSPVLSDVDNSAVAALAVAAALSEDRCAAASSLAILCGRDLADLPRSSSWLVTMNGVVEAAYLLRDTHVATRAYELLLPYSALPMVGSLGITCFGSAHQALGVAALTANQLDLAVAHLREAVQHNLALAHWPAVIASRRRLAQACMHRGQTGDTDTARFQLDAARSESAALGLPFSDHPVSGPVDMLAECKRVGRQWQLSVRHRRVLVADSVGMLHLAVLIANPRQEILAAELAAGLAAVASSCGDNATAHPVLDPDAIAEYRYRLKQLNTELAQLDPDDDEAGHAQAERDWIAAELAGATGLAGRTRSFSDQGERARVAVGKAIRRALIRITEADPVIGEHLRQTVQTGVRCSYWPG
jgi:hypothetical protein